MTVPHFDLAQLQGDWWEVAPDEAKKLEAQLRREVPKGHLLHRATVQAVAVRRHLKDVVFWLPGVEQWAYVHLTGRVEKDRRWPTTVCTYEWDQVVAEFTDD